MKPITARNPPQFSRFGRYSRRFAEPGSPPLPAKRPLPNGRDSFFPLSQRERIEGGGPYSARIFARDSRFCKFCSPNSHQVHSFRLAWIHDRLQKPKTRFFVPPYRAAIRNRRIDDATIDGRIGKHDVVKKLPDDRSAQTSMVKLNLANKQVDSNRMLIDRVLLDVSDRRVAMNDHEASNIFKAIDARRVFRDYLVEGQRFVGPPQRAECSAIDASAANRRARVCES